MSARRRLRQTVFGSRLAAPSNFFARVLVGGAAGFTPWDYFWRLPSWRKNLRRRADLPDTIVFSSWFLALALASPISASAFPLRRCFTLSEPWRPSSRRSDVRPCHTANRACSGRKSSARLFRRETGGALFVMFLFCLGAGHARGHCRRLSLNLPGRCQAPPPLRVAAPSCQMFMGYAGV